MAESLGDRRLRRRDRLRSRRDFARLSRDGTRRASGHFVVLASRGPRPRGAGPGPRLGITASRKVGNAVVRNRVKRRVREAFRRHRGLLEPGSDVVVIARAGAGVLSGERVADELARLFREAAR